MLETELVHKIMLYLEKHGIRNSREVRMGVGIPDIVINIGASRIIPQISDYYILSLIEYIHKSHRVSLEVATKYLSLSKEKCQYFIKELIKEKIIGFNRGLVFPCRKIIGLNLGKIISIEVKIKDWKNGFLQAQRYLMFSDYSYLALPESKIRNVSKNDLAEKGIGLLSITENGIEEILRPQESLQCDYKQKYIVTSNILRKTHNINSRKRDDIFTNLIMNFKSTGTTSPQP